MTATMMTPNKSGHRALTFEDLKGLRAEGYIRDSTLDQRDGYGPAMQRQSVERFAEVYDLALGEAWYTDFISGTSTLKRQGFLHALSDAALDRFDVLLVYHTSRFARSRSDVIQYKQELQRLGKTVVFVSQGIISGTDRDFLSEGINELLDEQYSRNLARFVSDGLRLKHEDGIANGVPPLGYRSEKYANGKRERKVPDLETMSALLELLRTYATGRYSYHAVAEWLNAKGFVTRNNRPFTKGSVEQVLENRFYEGQIVYHRGKPDEAVREGAHEVPDDVRALWLRCQEVKRNRGPVVSYGSRPRSRVYPLSGTLVCGRCGKPFHGETVHHGDGRTYRRMTHYQRKCEVSPRSVNAAKLEHSLANDVLAHLTLDEGWRDAVLRMLSAEGPQPADEVDFKRIEAAMANLRKQHLWGAISDEEFQREFQQLERQRKVLVMQQHPAQTPNLDRAAELLRDLPALWLHPGVTDTERREFTSEVFEEIRLEGRRLAAVTPRPTYAPLFAYAMAAGKVMGLVGARGFEPLTPCTPCRCPTRLGHAPMAQVYPPLLS